MKLLNWLTLYRLCLRLLPLDFRSRNQGEMERLFALKLAQGRRMNGRLGLCKAAFQAFWDVCHQAPGQRFRKRGFRSVRPPRSRQGVSMEFWIQDLRISMRHLVARPGLTLAAAATLALGIGATSAVFSLVDAIFLRPAQAVKEPGRLFSVLRGSSPSVSFPDYQDLKVLKAWEGLAASLRREANLGTEGETQRVTLELVTPNYFAVTGTAAHLGRVWEDAPQSLSQDERTVVLSHAFWQRSLGGDLQAIGRQILLNGRAYSVLGVAPAGFRGTSLQSAPSVWVPVERFGEFVPAMRSEALQRRHWSLFRITGRLAEGVTPDQARQELQAAGRRLDESDAGMGSRNFDLVPSQLASFPDGMRGQVSDYAALLLAVVGLVLMIACLNVANLMMVQASARRREFAIRQALGAGRGRLVRQLMLEGLLLAMIGSACGLIVAGWSLPLWESVQLPGQIRPSLSLDWRVFIFTIGLMGLATLVFGIWPALRASRPELVSGLKGEVAPRNPSKLPNRELLVVAQVALSTVLLVAAGLLLSSLRNLQAVDPGFKTDVLAASIDLDLQGYDKRRGWDFYERLLERLRGLPGVAAASLSSDLPLGPAGSRMGLYVEESEAQPRDVAQSIVAPGYFETLGIALLEGRDFSRRDRQGAAGAVIVNEAFQRLFWPGSNALGKGVSVSGPGGPFYRVVGVVADNRHGGLRQAPGPRLYWSHLQLYGMMSGSAKTVLLRAEGDPTALLPQLRRLVEALDAATPLYNATTLSAQLRSSMAQERQASVLLTAFAAIAVLLAAIGLFGVLSYAASRRRYEIGVRMALGARPQDARRLFLLRGIGLASAGLLLGLAGAAAVTRLLSSLLFEVSPMDPLVLALAAGVLMAVAWAACFVPAQRASRLDPARVLRCD